jgi:deoxyribose-phosphate aldolase
MNLKLLLEQADAYEQSLPAFPGGLDVEGKALAGYFDSTILKPEATLEQVKALCDDARQYKFAAVCINPIYVSRVSRFLKGSEVKNCAVVGFPLGASPTSFKIEEAIYLVKEGAEEVDMVIPIGMLKSGMYEYVYADIAQVSSEAHKHQAHCKVILEMGLLTIKEKIIGCLISQAAEADFVKTSTGMMAGGATVEDVELMRRVVGTEMGVKAAGGIRSLADARAMLKAGANRLGTSAAVKILMEATSNG